MNLNYPFILFYMTYITLNTIMSYDKSDDNVHYFYALFLYILLE